MKRLVSAAALAAFCAAATAAPAEFAPPKRLEADGKAIRVESPGYACPSWADLDGSGTYSLVVGQFRGGKMMAFKNKGGLSFAKGEWLKAAGKDVEVPGVW